MKSRRKILAVLVLILGTLVSMPTSVEAAAPIAPKPVWHINVINLHSQPIVFYVTNRENPWAVAKQRLVQPGEVKSLRIRTDSVRVNAVAVYSRQQKAETYNRGRGGRNLNVLATEFFGGEVFLERIR